MVVNFPCRICDKAVANSHKAIECDICRCWIHIKCNNISSKDYEHLKHDNSPWFCIRCVKETLPFSYLNREDLYLLLNNTELPSDTTLNLSPSIELAETINSLHNETETSVTTALKKSKTYLDIEALNKTSIPQNSIGILHLNIASISNHVNDLKILLNLSKHKFHIICLSESRLKKNSDPTVNIDIPGFTMEHTPTESSAGGTLIYISNNINYKLRSDLKIYKSKELESTFVELSFEKQQNIIIGCIYKHPSMTPDDFNSNYLEKLLNKTANIRKPIFLAGDFNFNLLKYGNHNGTTDFLDNLHSHYFLPLIISPTRITSHSATLIDNIFINENDFNISSGNILSYI